MTEKLYYQDAYMKEFVANITEIVMEKQGCRVRLDRTAFYPEGGGQGADHGLLILEDGQELRVVDVQETEGDIWHYVKQCSGETIVPGSSVQGRIDWTRRFDHMQQHSGEHIVSGMICRRFNCDNVGFHLGEDEVTIDYNKPITFEEVLEIEREANAYIWEDHPFQAVWPSPEELKTMEYRSKKELEGEVRITSFPGADTCACCGIHVSGSAQIGLVKFISSKPFREGSRLELLCGSRAMEYLSMNFRENKAAAVLLSTSEENTAQHVEKLLEEHLRMKASSAAMEDRMFHMWAESFRGKGNTLVIDENLSSPQARTLADLIADCCGGMAAVFARTDDRYSYAIIQRDTDISGFVKEMNQVLSGRGGGRNGFAQGSVEAEAGEIEEYFDGLFEGEK